MLHRALDQGRAGGQVLLDDQEIALPFGRVPGDVAQDGQGDAGPPAEADLAGQVLEVVGLTATENPTGKVLPSSSGAAG